MRVQRSERFDTDLERQFRWYLLETNLDEVDALALPLGSPTLLTLR
jgi:hypothetical protein